MYHELLRSAAVATLAGALVIGCDASDGAPLTQRQAVLGGEPTGSAHGGTLYLMSEIRNVAGQQFIKIGSSALVAPNLLATALHVVSQNPSNVPFTCDANGDVVSGSSGASLGAPLAPEKIQVYAGPAPTGEPLAHGIGIVSTGSTSICQNDLAFVILDHALELPTYPIRRGGPVAVGDSLTVVGYGSGLDSSLDSAVRSERAVEVTAVGQWIRTFTVGEGPCEGDSGGPALTAEGELAGIFSSVAVDCTAPGASPKYTDLSYFERLVERAFDEAGAGSPWPSAGEGGAAGAPAGEAGMSAGGGEPSAAPEDESDSSGCSVSGPQRAGGAGLALLLVAGAARCRRVRRRART